MKWEKVKLGDLYTVHNGLSKGKKFFGTGFPFLSFSIVFNKWFIPEQLYDLVEVDEKERNSYSIKKGDVFITRTSETMEELGMSTVALKDYPNATYNGFTKRLRPITELLEPRFIGYYLRTPEFRGNFMAFSAMTTRASLTNDDLLSLEVPVPPLPVQQRIASILSAYDDLIENNQKQIKLLEEAAQRLYKEWFVDLRFPGHENVKIVDGVPEGWKIKKIEELADTMSGGTPTRSHEEYYSSGEILWLKTKELNDGFIFDTEEKITEAGLKNSSAKLFEKGCIILAMYGATIGRLGISSVTMCCNQACCVIKIKEIFLFEYVYLWLVNNREMLISRGRGSAQSNLSQELIKQIEVRIPSDGVLIKFSNVVDKLLKNKEILEKQISSLREARDRLLPKLMSGEIEV